MNCSVCGEELNSVISWPKCGKCALSFHYRCTSGAMHQATWRSLTNDKRLLWLCSTCKFVTPVVHRVQKRALDIPVRNESTEILNTKLNVIFEHLVKLQIIPTLISGMREQLKDMQEENQVFLYKLTKMDDKIIVLELENSKLRAEIALLRATQQENPQYQGRNDSNISNVSSSSDSEEEKKTSYRRTLVISMMKLTQQENQQSQQDTNSISKTIFNEPSSSNSDEKEETTTDA